MEDARHVLDRSAWQLSGTSEECRLEQDQACCPRYDE